MATDPNITERALPDPLLPNLRAKAEIVARAFHEQYERLAPEFGYVTRPETSVPWEQLPPENRELMVFVVANLVIDGVIE